MKLNAAAKQIERGNTSAALNQLDAFLNEVAAMRNSGRRDETTAASLESAAHAMIDSINR